MCWDPCLVIISVQPWSTTARRWTPSLSGFLIICCVDKGVRNHKDVVIVCGKWAIGFSLFCFVNINPNVTPRIKAANGLNALKGEIGFSETGGRISQFKVAPQVMAANESIPVGRLNRILSL